MSVFITLQFGLHANWIEMMNFGILIYNPLKYKTNPRRLKLLKALEEGNLKNFNA